MNSESQIRLHVHDKLLLDEIREKQRRQTRDGSTMSKTRSWSIIIPGHQPDNWPSVYKQDKFI